MKRPTARRTIALAAAAIAGASTATVPAYADNSVAPAAVVNASTQPAAPAAPPPPAVNGLQAFFDDWANWVSDAKASQPSWASPIATTSGLLGQRYRFEVQLQQSGNGTQTTNFDNGKGVDLIVNETQEIRLAPPPYVIRTGTPPQNTLSGFGDWSPFRFKQRLFSSPQDQGNYVVSVWMGITLPTGIEKLTSHSVSLSPTIGFGKGWGAFDIQGNFGAVVPPGGVIKNAFQGKLGEAFQNRQGDRIFGNAAVQYQLLGMIWPELEVNWTYYANGPRAGLSRVFLTPGISIARIPITKGLKLTLAIGYQVAIAPPYRAVPLTPQYNNAWLLSTSLGF